MEKKQTRSAVATVATYRICIPITNKTPNTNSNHGIARATNSTAVPGTMCIASISIAKTIQGSRSFVYAAQRNTAANARRPTVAATRLIYFTGRVLINCFSRSYRTSPLIG